MKLKTAICFLILGTMVALNSCNKDYLIDVTGTLTGVVTDNSTGAYLKGATAKIIVGADTINFKDSTDVSGRYSISGIPLGDYIIYFTKPGYATVRNSITVQPAYNDNGTSSTSKSKKQSYTVGIIQDAALSPLSGKANGLITYYGAPAANVTVKAYTEFENLIFTTTTDASGYYSFSDLPISTYVTFTSSMNNASASETEYIYFGSDVQPREVSGIDLTENDLTVLSYTGQGTNVKLDTTASIVIVFSENVSEAITKLHAGGVYLYNGFNEVASVVTYSGNTITVKPVGGLNYNHSYSVGLTVYASDIKSCNSSLDFSTINRPYGTITGPATIGISQVGGVYYLQVITEPTSDYPINYYIYAKTPNSNEYLYQTYNDMTGDGYDIDGYITGTTFYVIPYINVYGFVEGSPSNISIPKP